MWMSKKKLDKLIDNKIKDAISNHKCYNHYIYEDIEIKPEPGTFRRHVMGMEPQQPDYVKHELEDVVQKILNFLGIGFKTTERNIKLVYTKGKTKGAKCTCDDDSK